MEMCSRGHDEIVYEYNCPACELIEKMASCPVCNKNKDITETDMQKEIKMLELKLFTEETLNFILQNENDKLKKEKWMTPAI